jgi:hypothetical protein
MQNVGPPSPPPHGIIIPEDVLDDVALVDPVVVAELVAPVVVPVVPVVAVVVFEPVVVVAPEVALLDVVAALPPEPLLSLQFGDARARSAIAPGMNKGSFDRYLTETFAIFAY